MKSLHYATQPWVVPVLVLFTTTISAIASTAIAQSITPHSTEGTKVNQQGQTYQITGGTQAGTNLFHSFQEFNVQPGEVAQFLTSPEIANLLGRVVGGQPSVIEGLLQVTGSQADVYLLNPAGIVFGAGARLDVPGSFMATTADRVGFAGGWWHAIAPNDYAQLTGNPLLLSFQTEQPSAILNGGVLSVAPGQQVSLIGGEVANLGTVHAPGGSILLTAVAGTERVRLSSAGHLLSLEVERDRLATSIHAHDLPALLTGTSLGLTRPTPDTVQVTGSDLTIPRAVGGVVAAGSITVANPAGQGGNVGIFGDRIALVAAQLDASGTTGGGEILIGGEQQGRGIVPNARHLFVDAASTLHNNAHRVGDGGRTILFATDTTQIFGTIQARGGAQAGNGGFVETSGLDQFTIQTPPDLTAPHGHSGTWLIDPNNIEIGSDTNRNIATTNPFESSDDGAFLNISTLLSALTGGATVEITTSRQGRNAETGTITLAADLDFAGTGDNTLILNAHGSIVLNGAIFDSTASSSNQLNLTLNADTDQDGVGRVEFNADLSTGGGDLLSNRVDITGSNPITINAGGGAIALQSGGNINLPRTHLITQGGEVNLTADQNIAIGSITVDNGAGSGGTIKIDAGEFFRASQTVTNQNGVTTSLSAVGTQGNGTISIAQSGLIPFTVGDASLNGTAGAISTGDAILVPLQSLSDSYNQGGIELVMVDGSETCFTQRCYDETDYEDQYEDQYDDPLSQSQWNQATRVRQNALQNIVSRTMTQPAILYARFAPTQIALSPTLDHLESEAGEAFHAQLNLPQDPQQSPSLRWANTDHEQLQLVLFTPTGHSVSHSLPVTQNQVIRAVNRLRRLILNPNSTAYLQPAQQLYQWLIAPIAPTIEEHGIDTVVVIGDEGLRSLPFAALHSGDRFLVEDYSLGQMPSLDLTDLSYQPLTQATVLAMGASQFTAPGLRPLPAVPEELALISAQRPSHQYLNADFTWKNLQAHSQKRDFQILHLATHAFFDPDFADEAHIQLWGDESLHLDSLRELKLYKHPPLELLILSACTTAIGNAEAELGFAGAAIQAGVKSVLASLWQVSDQGTLALMDEFYHHLSNPDVPIKAEALRQAQLAMLRGTAQISTETDFMLPVDLSHPFYWSAFSLIGSPW